MRKFLPFVFYLFSVVPLLGQPDYVGNIRCDEMEGDSNLYSKEVEVTLMRKLDSTVSIFSFANGLIEIEHLVPGSYDLQLKIVDFPPIIISDILVYVHRITFLEKIHLPLYKRKRKPIFIKFYQPPVQGCG